MQSLRTSCAQAQLAHFFCPCTVHRRVWDSYDGATFAFARVRHDWASHEWLPRSPGLFVFFFGGRCRGIYSRIRVQTRGHSVPYRQVACTKHQSRAHLISNESPRGKPGQNSMPTSADTRTYDRSHPHTVMAPPQVRGRAHSALAPRAVDLRYWGRPARRRPSPRLARRRARPATLRSPLALPQPIVVERGSAGR